MLSLISPQHVPNRPIRRWLTTLSHLGFISLLCVTISCGSALNNNAIPPTTTNNDSNLLTTTDINSIVFAAAAAVNVPMTIAISDRREAELSKSGFMPLIHRKNTDQATFIGAQTTHSPKADRKSVV